MAVVAPHLSHFPGLLGPMLVAVVVTSIQDGTVGLRDLLARVVRWRVPLRWYAAALMPAAAALLALGALALAGRGWPAVDELSTMPGVPELGWLGVFVVVLVVNGYGEEVGWRGFAWSRLRERHTLGGAALVLAVPWAIWHIPTFWLDTGLAELDLVVVPGWLAGLAAGRWCWGGCMSGPGPASLWSPCSMGSSTWPAPRGRPRGSPRQSCRSS